MQIKYFEMSGHGGDMREARSFAIDKTNKYLDMIGASVEDIIGLQEEMIPSKYNNEPSTIYLHVYYRGK